jgi:tetratricopeptide (TPR) repeat protein
LAIKCYKKATELKPNFIEAWNNLGLSYTFTGEYKQSIKCYEEALKFQKEDVALYENLAFSYSSLDDYDNAIIYYQNTLKIDPDNTNALKKLGLLFCEVKNNYKEAIIQFEKAASLDPSDVDFWESAVSCHKKLGNFEKAKEWNEIGSKLKAND